jgi:hypothetical protein
MPSQTDMSLTRFEDGVFIVSMAPSVNISNWTVRFQAQKRFGGISGFMLKSIASGYNNQSGINITNSGQGQFNVQLNSVDTSGLDYGVYTYCCERLDPGARTVLSEGFITLLPGGGV